MLTTEILNSELFITYLEAKVLGDSGAAKALTQLSIELGVSPHLIAAAAQGIPTTIHREGMSDLIIDIFSQGAQ